MLNTKQSKNYSQWEMKRKNKFIECKKKYGTWTIYNIVTPNPTPVFKECPFPTMNNICSHCKLN